MKRGWFGIARATWVLLLATAAGVLAAAAVVSPPAFTGYKPSLHPARGYREALVRIRRIEAHDIGVNPVCRTRTYLHGARTRDVVVFFHGLTNCPQQFDSLGRMAAAGGANVVIARIPRHGLVDRMTNQLGRMRAVELARFGDEVIDAAAGLGDHVTVVGLSLGGVLAAWVGQSRPEVERVVEIAPMFGIAMVPRVWTVATTRVLRAIPNRFIWWDGAARESVAGPPQVYPRFSTRALGETLLLGLAVRNQARHHPPKARELVLINLEDDPAVSNVASLEIAEMWRRAGVRVVTYEFPASLQLNHDMIDPLQTGARIDLVYPRLEEWITPVQNAR